MIETILVITIVLIDQITKYLSVSRLKELRSIAIIDGVFSLTYVENRGAAFGILQNQRWFFIVLTFIISIAMVYFLATHRQAPILLRVSIAFILGGALGNLIDRIRLGYVVDMLHFTLIDFPVFNVADCFVVVGTILLAYYILFMTDYNEHESL